MTLEMPPSAYNGAFGWGDDRKPFVHPSSTLRQQHTPIIGNSPRSESHQLPSYTPTGLAFNMNSWSNTAFLDPPYPVYGGGVWPSDPRLEEAHPGPSFSTPGGDTNAPGTSSLMGMEVAAPVLEQAFPLVQRALPATHPCPLPSPNWTQAPEPPWQPTSWDHPVRTARQHGDHRSSIDSLGIDPEAPFFHLATSSAVTGHPGRRVIPAGHLPSMSTPHSVWPSTHSDPVPASTSGPRGERLYLASDTDTFQCLWRSGGTRCTALIAGDRKGVSSHLRDVHGFMCDGQTSACAWGQCTTRMQRRNIPRHIIACHFEIKSTCSHCGLALSRADAKKKHRLACAGVAKMPAAAVMTEGGGESDGRLFFLSSELKRL